ncbi:MAG: formyl transferase [Planctomycetota bacterium]|nr:MAG: formyl transferase [Planctomycetota bacterium]
MMTKRVVLLGKGELAIRIAEWFREQSDYDLHYIVPVVPEPDWTDSLIDWCTKRGIAFVATGHYRDLPGVQDRTWHTDLAISVFYDRIIQPWFIEKCGRILNLHNGPLPRYRGIAPINWALKNGERMHGVTLHEITPEVDAGPIVAQLTYSIYPEFDEVIDVYRRALRYAYTLFEQTMPLLDRITPRPQNESEALYYSAADRERLGDRRDFTRALSRNKTAARTSP